MNVIRIFVVLLLFLSACSQISVRDDLEETDIVKLFSAMNPEMSYTETHFRGKEAAAIKDLVESECPQGPIEEFTRVIYEGNGVSLVIYFADDDVTCTLLKPEAQSEVIYKTRGEAPEGVAVTVNGRPIPLATVQLALDSLPENTPRDESAINIVLNRLINDELLKQEAEEMEISEEDIETARKQFMLQADVDENELALLLERQDISSSQFDDIIAEQAKLAKLLLVRLLSKEIDISEDDAKDFYLANTNQFLQSEQAVMRHILISSDGRTLEEGQERTQEVVELLSERDFCDLVREYSDDPQNKEQCGVYVIPRGVVSSDLELASFNTPVNQTSVVVTDRGIHLVQRLQVVPSQVVPYTQISESLRSSIVNNVFQQRLNLYLTMLRADAEIVVYLN